MEERTDDVPKFIRDAREIIRAAICMAKGRGQYDLAIGETLAALFDGGKLIELGCSREVDYARAQLGIPPSTMFLFTQLARGLKDLPLLKRAVIIGAVSPAKALLILPLAKGDAARLWIYRALKLTERELRDRIRAEGHDTPEDFEGDVLELRMTPEQQKDLDETLELAGEFVGLGSPRWMRYEAMFTEYLSSFPEWVPNLDAAPPLSAPRPLAEDDDSIRRQLDALDEAISVVEGTAEDCGGDPRKLDGRARRLLAARLDFDEPFGRLVEEIARKKLWRYVPCGSFEEFCTEKLGMTARSARERVWLERKMSGIPELREALTSGKLTYTKVILVAKGATTVNVHERIEEAAKSSWKQVERETTEEEDRKNAGIGVRRIWGPKDVIELGRAAIATCRAFFSDAEAGVEPEEIDGGEAMRRIARFVGYVWRGQKEEAQAAKGGRKAKKYALLREKVFRRTHGRCASPDCTGEATHLHHLRFRSHGGGDEEENCIGLCTACHLRAVHRGFITVTGKAGRKLVWIFGRRTGEPIEVWETNGDDDARRVG